MKWNGSDLHKLRLPPWIRAFPWACGMMLAAACLAADPEVQRLEESFAAAIKRVEQPISDLQDNYKNSLETWMAEAQQKGDLAAALAAKTEEETFAVQRDRQFDQWPQLKAMRQTYDARLSHLARQISADLTRLHHTLRRELQAVAEQRTRDGNLAEATLVAQRVAALDALITSGAAGRASCISSSAWELRSAEDAVLVQGCQLSKLEHKFVLSGDTSDQSKLNSTRSFEVPFQIVARVATDSTNIRFYYNNCALAIFNWERRTTEFRYQDPKTGQHRGLLANSLAPAVFHDIEIDIQAKGMTVRVDGKPFADVRCDYSDTDGPIGIGPAYRSILTVESLKVLKN